MSRVCAYIDGFNLYYGSLKGSGERWLDPRALLEKLISKGDTLEQVRYFTARVTDRNGVSASRLRQQTYLRALATLPMVSIHFGRFFETRKRARLVSPPAGGPVTALIYKTEEKGSDVNLATFLLVDGFQGAYDKAAVVSNDSDLVEPIRQVRNVLGKPVAVYLPTTNPGRSVSHHLKQVASYTREIRRGVLRASQLQTPLTDMHGQITKPPAW